MIRYLFLALLCYMINCTSSFATHIKGGYIRVVKQIDQTVTFQFVGFRDRGSQIELGGSVFRFGDGTFLDFMDGDFSLGDSSLTKTQLDSDTDLVVFELNHSYVSPGYYTVSYEEENRNADIINIENSVETKFYVETTFLLDPELTNKYVEIELDVLPVGFVGKVFQWAPKVVDKDGDLITFHLSTPKQENGHRITNFQLPNNAGFYSDYHSGNGDKDGTPSFDMHTLSGNLEWDAPGDAIYKGRREYSFAFRVTEQRLVNGIWKALSTTQVDINLMIIKLAYEPVLQLSFSPERLCDTTFNHDLNIVSDGGYELFIDVPFLGDTNGSPYDNPDAGLYFNYTDTILQSQLISGTELPYQIGHIKAVNGNKDVSFNIFYSKDCSVTEDFETLALSAPALVQQNKPLIFPNPNNGLFTIKTDEHLEFVKIISMTGQLVWEQSFNNSHTISLDLTNRLNKGFYIVQFFDGKGQVKNMGRLVVNQ